MASFAERYFRPKAFERGGNLYRYMGVVRFKRLLMGLVQPNPARPVTSAYSLGRRRLDDLREFERLSRRSEVLHLIGLAMALLFLALSPAFGGGLLVAGLVVLSANLHCFLLQRYNRARVYRLLSRARARGEERQVSGG